VLSLEFESSCERDSDENFEVVGETSDEGEEVCCDSGCPTSSGFVGVSEEGEEVDRRPT